MPQAAAGSYRPDHRRTPSYAAAVADFASGADTPSAFLERCLATIAAREPVVRAWVVRNEAGAREAAAASTARWQAQAPLSPIDGMPLGIKDLIETRDMPTQMGCEGYRDHFPRRDSALVQALRDAGAIILGKTVTTELGQAHPGPTTNPFHPGHSPGGSSSGSAAAVAAGMVPAAIGSQVGGSIIRPASYCGNVALKVSQGGLHRGESQELSQLTYGVLANSLEDMWLVAMAIASRVGGDPGFPGLVGPETLPASRRPARLGVLQTEAWAALDPAARQGFEALLAQLRQAGVEIIRREAAPVLEALERAAADAMAMSGDICDFEVRWMRRNLLAEHPEGLSARGRARYERSLGLTLEDYRRRLRQREALRRAFAELPPLVDALIAPSSPGPAPAWPGDLPGQPLAPRPTGDTSANAATSALGAPCVTVPLIAVGGLPFGVQVVGHPQMDAQVTGIARWMLETLTPVSV